MHPREKVLGALRIGRAARFVWRSARGWTAAHAALLAAQGVVPLAQLYLMKLVVDSVAASASAGGGDFPRAALLVALIGGVTLLGALLRSGAALVGEAQAQAVTDHMSEVLHAKSIEADLAYYESSRYYDTLHRAQLEAPFRPLQIVNGLAQLAQSGISLLGVAALLFAFNWVVGAVLFAAVVPGLAVRFAEARKLLRWQEEQTGRERMAEYLNWILTGGACAKEVRLFGTGPLFAGRFRELRKELREGRLAMAFRRSAAETAAQVFAIAAFTGSYLFISWRAAQGAITLGDLVMLFTAFARGQGFLQEAMGSLGRLYEGNLFLSHLDEFLSLERTVAEPGNPRPFPRPMAAGIAFDRVGFGYPGAGRPALTDVSFTVGPGEVVALVGENGSGKTTLAKLLCRLYDPTAGSVRIDGTDLREFATGALRREIAVLFQDFVEYHLTAGENIRLGNIALPPGDGRIAAAARSSGADQVIARLPRGYDTPLGKWFADGEELSVGEWQKIALARAFARDAQIMVLDEPTSSLDPRAEQEVFRAFRELAAGRAALIISHRFSTVRAADRILVLKEGRIIEGGSHQELVRLGGTYARLFELQSRGYR